MSEIKDLIYIDWEDTVYIIFILIVGITAMINAIERFSKAIGKPVKWVKKNDEDHTLLLEIVQEVKSLKDSFRCACNRETEIEERLQDVSTELLSKRIEDYRYTILNFASALATGKKYTKDQYDHIFNIHNSYEKLLAEHNMTNSQTDVSMRIIEESYKEKMKSGFRVTIENR